MPLLRRRTNSDTTTQPAGSGAVPGQRDTREGTRSAQTAEAERQRAEAAERERRHYGMAGTLMILSGMLTFFIGITALIRGIFFNNVATFPFYYSVRSRGITLIVIGAVAFVIGIALLIRMHWARHVATVIAVIGAVANFMFLPFYPFWSVIVLALYVLIIWELERDKISERGFARLPRSRSPAKGKRRESKAQRAGKGSRSPDPRAAALAASSG